MVVATDEIKNPKVDPTLKGQDLSKGEESNSNRPPRTYTQAEYTKGMEDAIALYGDRIKREKLDPITQERDTFKTERDSFKTRIDTELADAQKEITDLKGTLETLDSEDAAKVKQLIKDKQRELAELTTEKKNLEPGKQEVAKYKRDQEVYSVAFEHGLEKPEDLNAFMEAADDLGINDRGKLESLAKHRGLKVKEEVEPEEESGKKKPILTDSGKTVGGGELTEETKLKQRYPTMYSK